MRLRTVGAIQIKGITLNKRGISNGHGTVAQPSQSSTVSMYIHANGTDWYLYCMYVQVQYRCVIQCIFGQVYILSMITGEAGNLSVYGFALASILLPLEIAAFVSSCIA